jgi:HEAT repeat protein
MPTPAAPPPVATPVAHAALPALAGDVARALAIAEDERRFQPELEQGLSDTRAEVRARAAVALGRLQDTTTVAALLPLADDTDTEVRREALFALGQIGHRSALAALVKHIGDADAECGLLAIEAIGKLGDRSATRSVAALLRDRDARRRREAAVALWRLADSTAVGALLAIHDDTDAGVRWRVIYALASCCRSPGTWPTTTCGCARTPPVRWAARSRHARAPTCCRR